MVRDADSGLTPARQSVICAVPRGNSSVGRARPCQGRGREFESRFPLHVWFTASNVATNHRMAGDVQPTSGAIQAIQQKPRSAEVLFFPKRADKLRVRPRMRGAPSHPARWQSGHAAACKAAYAGSIPTLASKWHFRRSPSTSKEVQKKTPQFAGFFIVVLSDDAQSGIVASMQNLARRHRRCPHNADRKGAHSYRSPQRIAAREAIQAGRRWRPLSRSHADWREAGCSRCGRRFQCRPPSFRAIERHTLASVRRASRRHQCRWRAQLFVGNRGHAGQSEVRLHCCPN